MAVQILFGGDLSVRELLYGCHPRQAVPNLDEPLVVGADESANCTSFEKAGLPVSLAALRDA
jgi:hypothetical protein